MTGKDTPPKPTTTPKAAPAKKTSADTKTTSTNKKPTSANPQPPPAGGPSKPPASASAPPAKKTNTSTPNTNNNNATASSTAAKPTPAPGNKNKPPATATTSAQSIVPRGWDLRNFSMQVADAQGNRTDYDSSTEEFRFVANCCLIALIAFQRKDTQDALEKLAQSCAKEWTSQAYRDAHPEFGNWAGDKTKIKDYVKTFTDGIVRTPPLFVIDPQLANIYAAHNRLSSYDGGYDVLHTRRCFRLKVPVEMMESVKLAIRAMKTNPAYVYTLRMVLSLSFWHEFTHGFVTFLAGPKRARTPPECDPGFNKSKQSAGDQPTASMRGESGDFLECEVWGGAMQMDDVADPSHASKPTGNPFFTDFDGKERPVSLAMIKAFLTNPKVCDLKSQLMAVGPRSSTTELPPAKRRRVMTSTTTQTRSKMGWNISFTGKETVFPTVSEKEQTAVEVV